MPRKRAKRLLCPVCRKQVRKTHSDFPFCSERCRTIDLGRWASGTYVVSTPLNQTDQSGEAEYALKAKPAYAKEPNVQRKRS